MNVLAYVDMDEARTEQDRRALEVRAANARAEAIAREIDRGAAPEVAQAAGDEERERVLAQPYTWYETEPHRMYPPTIAHILEQLQTKDRPGDRALRRFYDEARRMPAEAWLYALEPYSPGASEAYLLARAQALELARKWFSRELTLATGTRVGLHIKRDPEGRYKLGVVL